MGKICFSGGVLERRRENAPKFVEFGSPLFSMNSNASPADFHKTSPLIPFVFFTNLNESPKEILTNRDDARRAAPKGQV